jgi:23S rRNA (cytosine1962-C5)-methyltransferase
VPGNQRTALPWQDDAALRDRLARASTRRAALAADAGTTAYRLVHGAADGLDGIAVDRFGDVLVANLYQELPAPAQQTLIGALVDTYKPRSIYVKERPQEAGRISEDAIARLAPPAPTWGEPCPQVTVAEGGLRYVIRPGVGLNVGLFLDMREMRDRVRTWAAKKTVLNAFAYTCGFGVAATAGRASRVLNLDLSSSSLTWGQENYRANGFATDDYDFVYGDVFDWLERLARRGQTFDVVILDPPGFARAHGRPFSATRDYARLAAMATRVVSAQGMLIACCNVAAVARRDLRRQVEQGIAAAGRTAEVVGFFAESPADFPLAPGAEAYLKLLVVRLAREKREAR